MVYFNIGGTVTLVIAYNASLLRIKKGQTQEISNTEDEVKAKGGGLNMANLPIFLIIVGLVIYGLYLFDKNNDPVVKQKTQKASLIGELSARRVDDRAFAYIPEKSFGNV